jgi:glycosyltransferase involved in cell wall biosynthesis
LNPRPYRVAFYCPDTHILYDGRTPGKKGVGGGITARVRMARALARAGHRVQMVVNCPRQARIDGVQYIPLGQAASIQCDVLIMNTSGGPLDLSPILDLQVEAGLKAVWTSGTPRPGGLERVGYHFVYAKSNFLRDVAMGEWGVPQEKIFVAYNGFEEADFRRAEKRPPPRDPHRLVYFSHPSKGLDTAIAITKLLRKTDPRFHLAVFGGPQLWGQGEAAWQEQEGVQYMGLIGQRRLARELMRCTYSLNLQDRLEPFGMVITESMRAGCVVLASPAGAYAELVRHGQDGLLVPGDHKDPQVRRRAADLILWLARNPEASKYLQRRARHVLWDTDTMVRVWQGHWRWWFEERHRAVWPSGAPRCPHCQGPALGLADGYHCTACGRYSRGLAGGYQATGNR